MTYFPPSNGTFPWQPYFDKYVFRNFDFLPFLIRIFPNLDTGVLTLFLSAVGHLERLCGNGKKYLFFWLAVSCNDLLFCARNPGALSFHCPRVSPGDQLLAKRPEDSGIEIGISSFSLQFSHFNGFYYFLINFDGIWPWAFRNPVIQDGGPRWPPLKNDDVRRHTTHSFRNWMSVAKKW